MKDDEKLVLVIKFITIVVGFGLIFYGAFVTLMIYNWHVLTVFSLPALSYWQMFALKVFWGVFDGVKDYEKDKKDPVKKIWIWVCFYSFMLFIGWILT